MTTSPSQHPLPAQETLDGMTTHTSPFKFDPPIDFGDDNTTTPIQQYSLQDNQMASLAPYHMQSVEESAIPVASQVTPGGTALGRAVKDLQQESDAMSVAASQASSGKRRATIAFGESEAAANNYQRRRVPRSQLPYPETPLQNIPVYLGTEDDSYATRGGMLPPSLLPENGQMAVPGSSRVAIGGQGWPLMSATEGISSPSSDQYYFVHHESQLGGESPQDTITRLSSDNHRLRHEALHRERELLKSKRDNKNLRRQYFQASNTVHSLHTELSETQEACEALTTKNGTLKANLQTMRMERDYAIEGRLKFKDAYKKEIMKSNRLREHIDDLDVVEDPEDLGPLTDSESEL